MKKLFKNLMFMALAAITFAACEDVPSPYDIPGTGTNVPGAVTEIEGGTGTGTLDDPYNAIAALNLGKKLASGETTDFVFIKGKVSSIKEDFTTQYGNGSFYLSEDGTATNQFYAYRVYYLGNAKFANGDKQVQIGDEVIVCGKITNYNGTIETAQNSNSFLYSLNGENRGGEPKPATPAADPKGDGTQDNPYNVSGVLKYIESLGSDVNSPNQVYVAGKISRIGEEYGAQYGNGTFYISDDGSASNEFYVFRALYLGNKKFANGDKQIKVGDEVIICGNVVNFRGNTPETVANASYLYSLNGETGGGGTPVTGEAKGSGTLSDPFNAVAAIAYAQSVGDKESDTEVYIMGKVATITDQYGTQFGNATFTVSDDGTANTTEFTIYRALYFGNEKYTSGPTLNVGDDVVVCGKVTNYRGNTPETVQGKAYLYSLNGKTEAGGGTEPGGGSGEAKGSGTAADPFNVQAIINYVSGLAADEDTNQDYYVKGIVTSIPNNGISTQYNNASFYISDDKDASNSFYVFRAKGLNGGDVTEDMLKVGDEVVIFCSTWVNYKGNTPETKQGAAYIVSITPGEGGGTEPGGGGGEVSGNTISVDFAGMGFDNAEDITTITLADGTTLTFSAGDNKNGPKYYNSGAAIRMYPQNFFSVNASKKIASILIRCSANNAEGQVSADPGTVSVNDMEVTISGIDSTSTKIANAHSGTGAASQLRISSLVITYAE